MPVALPASLPAPAYDGNVQEEADMAETCEFESGEARRSPIYRSVPTVVRWSWMLTQAEFDTYCDWFEDDLQAGALSFSLPVVEQGGSFATTTTEALFSAPPTETQIAPDVWRVDAVAVTGDFSGPVSMCSISLADDGAVFVLDVGDSDSYPGTGDEIFNIITSPDDGEVQSAYDFWLGREEGVDNRDPRLVGTAGDCSADFRPSLTGDGSYCLTAKQTTDFLQSMHEAGSRFTIEIWMYRDNLARPDFGTVPGFDSGCRDNGGPLLSGPGMYYLELGSEFSAENEHMISFARADEYSDFPMLRVADEPLEQGRVHMLACSIDTTGATPSFFYKNGAYDPSGGVNTWSALPDVTPVAGTPTHLPRIMGRADGVFATAQTRLHVVRVYNRPLTKAQLDANWNALRGRWGL